MTDLRKAAEMAFEALNMQTPLDQREFELRNAAIEALRQALAQPEQEQYVTKVVAIHEDGTYTTERIPLPKREWVGLTDEEILAVARDHYNPHQRSEISFAKAIEAKLKEKNA